MADMRAGQQQQQHHHVQVMLRLRPEEPQLGSVLEMGDDPNTVLLKPAHCAEPMSEGEDGDDAVPRRLEFAEPATPRRPVRYDGIAEGCGAHCQCA